MDAYSNSDSSLTEITEEKSNLEYSDIIFNNKQNNKLNI